MATRQIRGCRRNDHSGKKPRSALPMSIVAGAEAEPVVVPTVMIVGKFLVDMSHRPEPRQKYQQTSAAAP